MAVLAAGLRTDGASGQHFKDVSVANPFYAYIETAYAHGIVSGYADGTFRPDRSVTRGEVARVALLSSGLAPVNPAKGSFSDVATSNPNYRYIEAAKANGLLSGYSDGTFRPDSRATRGEIAKIVFGISIACSSK
jgi:5'-nucleotidase/2',3'-cyclic-nucleotide 2'-phosphodiesterase/3'-nucleotidase/5'-nucleotidase